MSHGGIRPRVGAPGTPASAQTRLLLALTPAVIIILLLSRLPWPLRVVAGWDAFAILQLLFAWEIVRASGPDETRRMALARDAGRQRTNFLVLAMSFTGIVGAISLLRLASRLAPHVGLALVLLCLLSIVTSWLLLHVSYGGRYARIYFRSGGLQFPGEHTPDDWDFLYFSFTLGMCFQVSDVVTSGAEMRRTALGHALLSFAFNTSILAVAMSLVGGLLGP